MDAYDAHLNARRRMMHINRRRVRRLLLGTEASAVFFLVVAIYSLSIGQEWFGAAWAWLSGAQFSVAAWLRSERKSRT